MTPEQRQKLKINLQEIADIFYQNTPPENLQSFESIELTVREQIVEIVAPEISGFFYSAGGTASGRKRTIKSCVGEITLSSKQAQKLGVNKGSRLSPHLEKCCLLLVGNESFANAERDLKMLTGIYVSHSTQHRLLERYKLLPPETTEKVEALSIDGGNVRLRTHEGEESVWKN